MIKSCRSCGYAELKPVISLGEQPAVNELLTEDDLNRKKLCYPLQVVFCPSCSLLQITETISPSDLFKDYSYFSSYSDTMLEHARTLSTELIQSRQLSSNDLVVELASNDGYLLQYYKKRDIPVLGIEPAENIARVAEEEKNIPTRVNFFDAELARELVEEGKRADVIHAHNVLAHVPGINDFVRGIEVLLKEDGLAVIEVPYVKHLIDGCEFDTIYHEHVFYFSLTALKQLFVRHGLDIDDVTKTAIHGGSLRLYVKKTAHCNPSQAVTDMLEIETKEGVDRGSYYRDFEAKVQTLKKKLTTLLSELKRDGHSIAGYGAAAKGCILLNYLGIGRHTIDYVVDRSPHKQGRYMPGVRLPIKSPKQLKMDPPDYLLILPWNLAGEIMDQQSDYLKAGGKCIVPIPEPRIYQEGGVEVEV